MKVILYMGLTSNGFIAKEDDNTSWISQEEWDSYSAFVRKVGCMIIGHRTYDILTKQPEFSELKEVKIVVISHKDFKTLASNHFTAKTPRKGLDVLKNVDEVIVAGGGQINSVFMKEGLIDEIYLDVEPLVFGKGIQLFSPEDFEYELELIEINKLNQHTVQLHYQVIK